MRILQSELSLYERRISKIKSNPDPSKMRSNLLFYELQYARRKSLMDAWETGSPIVECSGQYSALCKALGLESIDYGGIAERLATSGGTAQYFDRVRELGLPDHLCDRTVIYIPMVIDGDLPRPDFVISSNFGCEAHHYGSLALAHQFGVPTFNIDVPYYEPREDILQYVTGQLRRLIRYAEEKVPGAKYDEAKLVEIQEMEREYNDCIHDVYLARKSVPCPEGPQDVFRIPPMPSNFPDVSKAVEYAKTRRAEVMDRVARGTGGVKKEQLRLMWTNTGPFYANVFDMLADRGASVVFFLHGHAPRAYGAAYGNVGDETEFGRKLNPLEEQARLLFGLSWGGLARRWNRDLCNICRELNIDAIVDFQQEGCVQIVGWQRLMDEAVERNLGIPIIHIEGRMLDTSAYNKDEFNGRLMAFVDRCIASRKAA